MSIINREDQSRRTQQSAYHGFIWSVWLFFGELLCVHVMLEVNRIGSKSSEASTLTGFGFGAALLSRGSRTCWWTWSSRTRFWVLILTLFSLFILILCGLRSVASSWLHVASGTWRTRWTISDVSDMLWKRIYQILTWHIEQFPRNVLKQLQYIKSWQAVFPQQIRSAWRCY